MKTTDMRPMKYAMVGVANTLLYAGLLFVFLKYFESSKPVSVALAFILAMIFQYFANRAFTFRSQQSVGKELPRYLVAAFLNYLLTLFVVFVSIDICLISEVWASIFASLLTAVSGYFLALLWVFK